MSRSSSVPGRFSSAMSASRESTMPAASWAGVPRASLTPTFEEAPAGWPPTTATASSNSGTGAAASPSSPVSSRAIRSNALS